jgi:hypothetical protein
MSFTDRRRRVGKGASRGAVSLARTVMRLCPRWPTSPSDRVGKVAQGQRAISSAMAGDFAHPTTLTHRLAMTTQAAQRSFKVNYSVLAFFLLAANLRPALTSVGSPPTLTAVGDRRLPCGRCSRGSPCCAGCRRRERPTCPSPLSSRTRQRGRSGALFSPGRSRSSWVCNSSSITSPSPGCRCTSPITA